MLTSKQRAYLRSLANPIDTILIIGKSNLTEEIIKQAEDALLARELIKGKVLETAEATVNDVALKIAEKTDSIVVATIGSKFILYKKNDEKPKINLPKN